MLTLLKSRSVARHSGPSPSIESWTRRQLPQSMRQSLGPHPYPVSDLAMILFGLSSMLDSGEHDDITLDEVKRHSQAGDLIDFLKKRNGGSFAMNITDAHPNFRKWYTRAFSH